MGTSSQVTEIARLLAAVDGIQKHYPNGQFSFGGAAFTTPQVVALFQAAIADLKAATAARAVARDAVAVAHVTMQKARPVYLALIDRVESENGNQSVILAEFGKSLKARKIPSAEAKAAAAAKAKATRARKKAAAAAAANPTTPKS